MCLGRTVAQMSQCPCSSGTTYRTSVELKDALGKNVCSFQHNALYFTFTALYISEIWRLKKKRDNLKRPCVSMLILRFSRWGLRRLLSSEMWLIQVYGYYGGIHSLYLWGRRVSQATNQWGESMFLQNASKLLPHYKVSHLRWEYSSCVKYIYLSWIHYAKLELTGFGNEALLHFSMVCKGYTGAQK